MQTSLPSSICKSMVRIEKGESTMLDLSSGNNLTGRNAEYAVAFFRAMAAACSSSEREEDRVTTPPTARGLTIRCRFTSLQALSVLCDYLVADDCQIRVLILSLTHLSHAEVCLLVSAICNNRSIDEFAIYNANTQPVATSQLLPGSYLQSLLQHNQSIRKLTLVGLHLKTTACYAQMAKGLARHVPSLESLSLDSCTPSAAATAVLLEALVQNTTEKANTTLLTHLHLGHVHLSTRVIQAVRALACHASCSSLKHVSIVGPCNGEEDAATSLALSGLLGPTSSIEKLTLDSCNLNDEAAVPVFTALETNTRCCELNLPRNHLTKRGYQIMLASMAQWRHLRRLSVDGGGELLACQEDLVKGMRANRSLHHLGLETFDLGPYNPQIRSHSRRFLRRNRRLDKVRKLLLHHQSPQICSEASSTPTTSPSVAAIPPGLWAHILKCVSVTRRDHVEMAEAFQLVQQHAIDWSAFGRTKRNVDNE